MGVGFGFNDAWDPTGEYLGDWFGICSNLLTRTLVCYELRRRGAGQRVVPRHRDASQKRITNNGKT